MTESELAAKLQKREVYHFVRGVRDGVRRRVWPRAKVKHTSADGKSFFWSNSTNPHLVHDRWDGKWFEQALRDDQIVCDMELEPGSGVLVQQVIARHRIQTQGG